MPHGKIVLFPTIVLSIAATLSMIVLPNCTFVESKIEPQLDPGYYYSDYGAGFWPLCGPYSSFEQSLHRDDPNRKVAMSFGLIACIVGVGAMIALWPITCKPYSIGWIRFISATVVFVFASQLATLSMLGTNYCQISGCRLGWGGIMSIIAAILWLIGAVGICMIPKPIEQTQAQNETTTTTETVLPDGSKVTETVTTSLHGTKTIERTIEKPLDSKDGITSPQGDVEGGNIVHAVPLHP
jgi:NADH:ubiquinone oxidoreductase subunit 3 (subunit A)